MIKLDTLAYRAFQAWVNRRPHTAARFEYLAAAAQGKGFGTATIDQEVRTVLCLLSETPILAVDIGANVGDYTHTLRRQCPRLEIHAFEPSATNLAKLTDRYSKSEGITIVPYAVSSTTGTATLFSDSPGSGMGSLSKRRLAHFEISFDRQEPVRTMRFEEYWKATLKERSIDLAKLDIEGHELSALEGFGKAIHSTRAIQFEFGGCNIDTRTFFQDFWYFFADNNFSIFRITPLGPARIDRYREADEFFSTTNFVAINDRMR